MTITARVRRQMFQPATAADAASTTTRRQLIRIPLTRLPPVATAQSSATHATTPTPATTTTLGKAWTPEEHERFLEGLEVFPAGPWRRVAEYVGTKNARQVMTHAQKYRQKIARRARNLELLAQPQLAEWPQPRSIGSSHEEDVTPSVSRAASPHPVESIKSSSVWDVVLDDLTLDWNIDSPQVIDSERLLLDHEDAVVVRDVSPLFQELMQDANNLTDELLLSESAALLGQGAGEPSYPSWSLGEAFVFVTPHENPLPRNVGLISHRHQDDQRIALSSDDELMVESHGDFQIWFGE
ncbi:Myb-like dna-binding protein [Globisporangium polare]